MVAEEAPFPSSAIEEGLQRGGERLGLRRVAAVGPEMVEGHGNQGYEEEGSVYVGDQVGLVVGGVCEDCLAESVLSVYACKSGHLTYAGQKVGGSPQKHRRQQQRDAHGVSDPAVRPFALVPHAHDARRRAYGALQKVIVVDKAAVAGCGAAARAQGRRGRRFDLLVASRDHGERVYVPVQAERAWFGRGQGGRSAKPVSVSAFNGITAGSRVSKCGGGPMGRPCAEKARGCRSALAAAA